MYASSEPQQDIQSTGWVEVASVSKTIDNSDESTAEFMIWVNSEYAGENVGEAVGIRVLLDGVEVAFDHFEPFIANQFRNFSPFGMATLSSGLHIVSLEARCVNASQTVKVRRNRLLVMKH